MQMFKSCKPPPPAQAAVLQPNNVWGEWLGSDTGGEIVYKAQKINEKNKWNEKYYRRNGAPKSGIGSTTGGGGVRSPTGDGTRPVVWNGM